MSELPTLKQKAELIELLSFSTYLVIWVLVNHKDERKTHNEAALFYSNSHYESFVLI